MLGLNRTRGRRARSSLSLKAAVCVAAGGILLPAAASHADDGTGGGAAAGPVPPTAVAQANGGAATEAPDKQGFFSSWLDMVTRTQSEQPHWMTPLVTVTPRLEQEFRYDQFMERLPSGANLNSYGGGKGLEIIPSENTEVIFGIPPYEERTFVSARQPGAMGAGDWPFLLVKYRLASGNEEHGNYIVTAFLQASAPTGSTGFTSNFYLVQPTIAAGKGWGDFDVQATLSEQFPVGGSATPMTSNGRPILANVSTQYHAYDVLWPEFEANYTYWPDGIREGKSQLYLTPGIIFGRFPIYDRVKLIFGIGYQFAVSPHDPGYNNNVILTMRTTF